MEKSYEGIPECYYRVSAKALIRNEKGEFLLAKENTGLWDIPGGGIDHGEEIHDALKREIFEEMGLKITYIAEQPCYVYLAESSGVASPKRPICLLIFDAKVENYDITPSDECEEIKFVTAKSAQDLPLYYPNEKVMKEMEKQEA